MAKISEAFVYVEEVNGNRLRLSEKHSRRNKDDDTQWDTLGYTDVNTAWMPKDYSGPAIEKGQRVKVSGAQRTENREHQGKTYKNLVWHLDTIEIVPARGEPAQHPRRAQSPQSQEIPPEEVPF